jgi:stringent starvation protein B
MSAPARISRRPYLLRAMHQWMTDSDFTPHVIVNAEAEDAQLPRAYARDGKIVLNVSYNATQHLDLGNDWVQFDARFSGVVQRVRFPVGAVLGIYARETGEGMVFSEVDGGGEPPPGPGAGPGGPAPDEPAKRPQLKIVK